MERLECFPGFGLVERRSRDQGAPGSAKNVFIRIERLERGSHGNGKSSHLIG